MQTSHGETKLVCLEDKYREKNKRILISIQNNCSFRVIAPMKRHPQISEFEQYVIEYSIKIRKQRDLTQEDIANILKVTKSFITAVENLNLPQKYNMDHVNALADHFGISPREFFPEKAFPVD